MENKMCPKCQHLFCFLLWPMILAIPDHTNDGTDFVVIFPLLPAAKNVSLKIVCVTYSSRAALVISEPDNVTKVDSYRKKHNISLERYKAHLQTFTTEKSIQASGFYAPIIIKASTLIKVFAEAQETTNSDFFEVIPLRACYTSYFVTSLPYTPFVSAITFHTGATLKVTFPEYEKTFKVDCKANKQCTPGTQVTVTLNKYTAWHFLLDETYDKVDIHNTKIEATNPIFVISGNFKCQYKRKYHDLCLAPAKPQVAWGKSYVVPFFEPHGKGAFIIPRINILTVPFSCSINFKKDNDAYQNTTVNLTTLATILYYEIKHPVVISAEKPFGVGLFYSPTGTHNVYAFLNLAPVEQWTNGVVHVFEKENKDFDIFDAFIVSTTDDVEVPEHNGKIEFESLKGAKMDLTFHYTQLKLGPPPNRIHNKMPTGKVMVYMADKGQKYALSLRAQGFYLGEIYSPHCKTTAPVESDGVDNDCDGFIDEELLNKKDDDGDGKVDEDLILLGTKSEWSPWKLITYNCKGNQIAQSIRSCKVGPLAEMCSGKKEQCSTGEKCPTDCKTEMENGICLSIEDRCSNCSKGVCHQCKAGYIPSNFCLHECPRGWGEINCNTKLNIDTRIPPTATGNEVTDDGEEKKDSSWLWSIIPPLIAIAIVTLCCIRWCMKRRRKYEKAEEEEGEVPRGSTELTPPDNDEVEPTTEEIPPEEPPEEFGDEKKNSSPGEELTPEGDSPRRESGVDNIAPRESLVE